MVYWLTHFASWLAGRTPRRARLALAGPLATLIYYAWVSKRRVTVANMAQILDVTPSDARARRLARQSWRNYGRYLSDFLYMPNSTSEQVMARLRDTSPPPGSLGNLEETLARGKGILLVTAHFGAWDVAAAMVASQAPLHVVADSFTDRRMDELIQGQRAHFGMRVLRAEKSPRPILRALKDGHAVAVVADRPMTATDGVPITFFGKRCYVPGGAAQIALLADAPLAVGAIHYDERFSDAYYTQLHDIFYPERTGDREADVQALTQRVFSVLEGVIREYPNQWFMFRRFWPKDDAANDTAGVADDAMAALAAVRAAPRAEGDAHV
jgi:KDO2-lipid IV(A) lauroyltransferase